MIVFSRCSICQSPLVPFRPTPCDSCVRRLSPAQSIGKQAPFHAIRARWFLVGTTYRLFLDWKSRPTPRNTKLLLKAEHLSSSDAHWAVENGDILVPIPQLFSRAWRLHHSPALRAARALSTSCRRSGVRVPVIPILQLERSAGDSRQATLRGRERWSRKIEWKVDSSPFANRRSRIILVDDVLTTGATFASAASILLEHGYSQISAWALGVRPSFSAASIAASTFAGAAKFEPKTCSSAEATP